MNQGTLGKVDPDFNPRSREGSDFVAASQPFNPVYFNPRSREGSDLADSEKEKLTIISIHAPARGATSEYFNYNPEIGISIHAPARGATIRNYNNLITRYNFNPRSREGSDNSSRDI